MPKTTNNHYVGYGMSDKGFSHNKISSGTEDYRHFQTLIYFNDGSYKLEYYKDLDPSKVESDSKNAKFTISGLDSSHSVGTAADRGRSAMGIKKNGQIIFISTSENPGSKSPVIEQVLKDLSAVDILMLDGGGSVSFYADGEMKIDYGRNVASVFEVYK